VLTYVLEFLSAIIPDWQSWLVLAIVAAIAIGILRSLLGHSSPGDD